MSSELREIMERITERYEMPIQIGSRCETNTFYRVEDLTEQELSFVAGYIAERIRNVSSPSEPEVILSLPGSYAGLARALARELSNSSDPLDVIHTEQLSSQAITSTWLRNTPTILVNEVITTARTCLEAHNQATLLGASVLCWAALIDRTFGPGPVSIVAALTGEPVRLLDDRI
jgi:hypothetical protein